MADLPHIDEHTASIAAPREQVWETLVKFLPKAFGSPTTVRTSRILGCADTEVKGSLDQPGATFPGFHVASAQPPTELALEGRHRFSHYTLTIRLDEASPSQTTLRAETRAAFPGLKGQLYKTLVIRTRMHVLVTRRVLSAVKRRAER